MFDLMDVSFSMFKTSSRDGESVESQARETIRQNRRYFVRSRSNGKISHSNNLSVSRSVRDKYNQNCAPNDKAKVIDAKDVLE